MKQKKKKNNERLFCLSLLFFLGVLGAPTEAHCQLLAFSIRDVLFSGSAGTENILLQMQSLLVSSHYRNSPDDLQMLADAPAHHLFVLLPPLPGGVIDDIPPILCVVQVRRNLSKDG